MAGHSLGIFATQARSIWGQRMIEEGRNNFGHKDVTWRKRALLAIPEAGIVGQTLTAIEMEDALIPFVGPTPDIPSRSCMVSIGVEHGIIEATGTWRRPDGHRRKLREYKINGHMAMEAGRLVPVLDNNKNGTDEGSGRAIAQAGEGRAGNI